jgi:hypothetical protein
MSISEVENSPSDRWIELESLAQMPFSGWVHHQLSSSSFFSPSECQLRIIEDKGSIAASLCIANIEILKPVKTEQYLLIKTLRKVCVFAVEMLAILPSAVLGIGYHLSQTGQHLMLAITDQAGDWEKVHHHKNCMLYDLRAVLIPVIVAVFTPSMPVMALLIGVVIETMAIQTGGLNSLPGHHTLFLIPREAYAYHKAWILRNEFGIVGSSRGEPLTWNADQDKDLMINAFGYVQLSGYFGILYEKKREKCILLLEEICDHLPKKDMTLTYPLFRHTNIKEVTAFLDTHQKYLRLSGDQVSTWTHKLTLLEEELLLVKRIITQAFRRMGGFPEYRARVEQVFSESPVILPSKFIF